MTVDKAIENSDDDQSTASSTCTDGTDGAFLEMLGLPALDALSTVDAKDEIHPTVSLLEVPHRCSRYLHEPIEVAAFVIDNFLDATECQELIQLAGTLSNTGFHYVTEAAHTDNDGVTHMVKLQEPNKHKLSVFEHAPTLEKLWKRMKPLVLPQIQPFIKNTNCGPPLGLNPRLRVLRYDYSDNDVFASHFDATTKVGKHTSLLTVLIYLNNGSGVDFDGGETCYIDSVSPRGIDNATKVTPTAGKVVVFEHDLFHSSVPLTFGTKYVLRTDILFELDAINGGVDKPRGDAANANKSENDACTLSELCERLMLSNEVRVSLDEIGMLDLTLDSLFAPGVSAVKQMLYDVLDDRSAERLMEAALLCR